MGRGRSWSEAEDALVRERYRTLGPKGCAELLPGRSAEAIKMRAHCLSASRARPRVNGWSAAEDQVIRECYPGGGALACMRKMPRRSWNAIAHRAGRLGVTLETRAHWQRADSA